MNDIKIKAYEFGKQSGIEENDRVAYFDPNFMEVVRGMSDEEVAEYRTAWEAGWDDAEESEE